MTAATGSHTSNVSGTYLLQSEYHAADAAAAAAAAAAGPAITRQRLVMQSGTEAGNNQQSRPHQACRNCGGICCSIMCSNARKQYHRAYLHPVIEWTVDVDASSWSGQQQLIAQ
jgi:hypothetical protein